MAKAQILIVEDESIVARDIQLSLERLGYGVSATAASGQEAIQRASELRPDLVLMDIILHGAMDGVAAAAAIRDHLDIPIIYLTAHSDPATLRRAKITEPFGYLLKPFAERELNNVIEMALYKHQMEQKVKEHERGLAEANRRKDEFLAMLAHELRNPLAPIQNAMHILRQRNAQDATVTWVLDIMERQVRHMGRLVDDLLDVSRITRGKIPLRKETLPLATVVARVVEAAQPLIDARRHEFSVTLPPEQVRLEADPTRLEQVLANLLNNAAKFTEPGGRIWLTAHCDGDEVVLRVGDTGIGIAPDVLPHVFDLFTQADRSLDRSQGGLGIGLTLVQRLVELHGGSVSVSSGGLGQGSEFTVRLPKLPEATHATSEMAAGGRAAATQPLHVLVVDDNQDMAHTLALLLDSWGHRVTLAHDGPSAVQAASDCRPNVVLLDIGLPGKDGYSVATELRRDPKLATAYLVALTGYGRQEDRRRSCEAGFDVHLTKPVDPAELERLLASLTAGDRKETTR